MSEAAVLWVVGTLVTLVVGLGAMFLSHMKDCRDWRIKMTEEIGDIKSDIRSIKESVR